MRCALALLLGLLICTELNAAAWTLDKGHAQVINNFTFYTSDQYVNKDGHSIHQETYKKWEYNPYMEYGFTNSVTLGLSPSFQYVTQNIFGKDRENYNLVDSDIFIRKRLYSDGQNVISIQPLIKLPGFYSDKDLPVLGQNQIDYELRLLYGLSFGTQGKHYWSSEVAYRVRTELPGNEWRLASTLGYQLTDRWQVLGEVNGIFAADGAGDGTLLLSNSYDYDLVKVQLSGLYWFKPNWALQLGAFQTVYERNTGEGTGALFSVWYRF